MLQQTRVAAVLPFYERFLTRFPDIRALAEAPEEEVLHAWSGLGYYGRARNLHRAARQLVAKHGGRFPRHPEEVASLPGIGGYTTAAVMSIAYGKPLAVLDGNVARVLARLEAVRGDLREPRCWRALQHSADQLLDRRRPGAWNQAMMELGATVCVPGAPMCLLCPVSGACRARSLGLAQAIPEKRKKPDPLKLDLAAAVFFDKKGRTLLLPPQSTAEDGNLPGAIFSRMWHFPVLRLQSESSDQVLDWLRRRFGRRKPFSPVPLKAVRQAVTHHDVHVVPHLVKVRKLPSALGARPVSLGVAFKVPVSNLTNKIARAVRHELAAPGDPRRE